ncbi:GNAT family N-acetyltransferase [Symbiopectobacterium purcellii]|uniref:N-acetyltransferase domain-containing protein n=1 Tax=Symbiopectobacterium purcellii TaxID=2871826 RepID=A0ABX9ARI9_9ENTR|nr:GNAT family N-acetyltransferase [Symbiopectobacterium purcellii]QZN97819.1 hypothetical protein K6K13_11245 [Symbiopectobacterium purcellii]
MNFYPDPPENDLKSVQEILAEENENNQHNVGIEDIWMDFPGTYYAAKNDVGKVVAAAAVASHDELYKLYVIPEARKNGIAEDFVLHLIGQIAEPDGDGLFVEMTNKSLPFWDRTIKKHELRFKIYEGQPKIELWLK